MTNKLIYIIIFTLLPLFSYAKNDSLDGRIIKLEYRVEAIDAKTEQVKKDQLNYSIERDLLKEAYSNNYETASKIITLILAILGIFGYIGIKDIGKIKKEYNSELQSLRTLKLDFEAKSKNLDTDRDRVDSEIKEIIKQNEEQNKKIKILELRERAHKSLIENQATRALEYATVGLELVHDDIVLLDIKAQACCRLNQLSESLAAYKKAYEIEPSNLLLIANYIECLFLSGNIENGHQLLNMHAEYFKNKEDGNLRKLFTLFELYYSETEVKIKEYIETLIDFENIDIQKKTFKGWRLAEALAYIKYQENSGKKTMLQHALWYLDGQLTGRTLCTKLQIKIPKT